MRIVAIHERTIPISRYRDPSIPSGGLTTSIVAVVTDVVHGGEPIVGYGFSSMGRYAQGGLIRERFAPRLLGAPKKTLNGGDGNVDPFKCWRVMMSGEKPGGHGERCVAVGTLDMALWDVAAKIAAVPLAHYLALRLSRPAPQSNVPVYAGGGYYYPYDDVAQLREEITSYIASGYTGVKIKIGAKPLAEDCARIDAALEVLGWSERLAVDAMNAYDRDGAVAAARELRERILRWFEDVCDPLDFETQGAVKQTYQRPIAAGEALFSHAEAKLLAQYGGLNRNEDILLFDPVHAYGIPEYARIVDYFENAGWPRSAFWPHGGHLFSLHIAAALGLGGAEVNPFAFPPFGGLHDSATIQNGVASIPNVPGIGFELKPALYELFRRLYPGVTAIR